MERRVEDRDYWNKQLQKRGLASENEEYDKVVQSNFTACVYLCVCVCVYGCHGHPCMHLQYVCVGHCECVYFYL